MRRKAALIIIVIAFAITIANFGLSLILTRQSLTEMMGQDITLALDIANDLISTSIRLYKSNAQIAAERLMKTDSYGGLRETMREQLDEYADFMAFTVFSRQGVVAEYGDSPASALRLNNRYIVAAFNGQTIISTSAYSESTGKLVMYVCTPLGSDWVLAVTIPGLIFSEDLSYYRLWDSGNIWMLDEEGTVIAHRFTELVDSRASFLGMSFLAAPPATESFFANVLNNESGLGTYTYDGVEYQCAYQRVFASESGWRIGLSVPLAESPLARVQNTIILLAILFFAFSIIVAVVTSNYLAMPYDKITEQNRLLGEKNEETLHLQNELEVALKEAQDANSAKSSFLASMSHEMRTPLNAVVGLSELILNAGDVRGELENMVGTIHTSGLTMLGLVNDILDISKIEHGRFDLNPTEYDIPSLINDIISLNTVRIGEKPIKFILTLDENMPWQVYGDDLRVKQIFNNLLSNAFKYTNSGTVNWTISYECDGTDLWILSEVRDTGIGIKPDDIAKLFQEYSQVDTQTNRKAEGTGLGLSITKRLVSMMDGSISVESEYGKGSAFSLRLRQKFITDDPIGRETAHNLMGDRFSSTKRAQRVNLTRPDLSYARVLVVDDMRTNLDVAKGMLVPYGIHVDTTTGGQKAIEMIEAGTPRYDAIFMDHMMPGMDGIEATRIIREEIDSDYARNIPIIALTANAIAGNEKMFLSHGFQAFISKPVDMIKLDMVLRRWVRNKDREMERDIARGYCVVSDRILHSDSKPTYLENSAIEGVDIFTGMERFGNSESAYISVLQSYAVNTRPLLGDLENLLSSGNLDDFAITAHGIKGSSLGVGAARAGQNAERLERLAKEGKHEQVLAETSVFIKYMVTMLDSIDSALIGYYELNKKPVMTAPDPVLLQDLRKACMEYDVGRVDEIMSLLSANEYESGGELISWLRGQAEDMNYEEIAGEEWPGGS